jgi:flagellar biosynthetic protein FlhB
MSDQQTEQATPRRKEKAREQGDYVHSRELMAAVAMLGGVLSLGAVGKSFTGTWGGVYGDCIALAVRTSRDGFNSDTLVTALKKITLPLAMPVVMVLVTVTLGSLFAGLAQSGGVQVHVQALQPKFQRLNPVSNVSNLFSLRSTTRLGKSLIPAAIVLVFGWQALRTLMEPMPILSTARLPAVIEASYGLMKNAAWVMLGWSALDYVVEWMSYNKRLMMSKQEMRDEMRDAMGNPQIKGRIRNLQRAMRQRKRRADVSTASVVITNPTHYAVALKFDFTTMQAPTVMAKGRNLMAEEIKKEARWAGVPIVENPPLARSLYRMVEPGQSIPADLYAAVAAILAYLYRQQVEEQMRQQRVRERESRMRVKSASTANRRAAQNTFRPPIDLGPDKPDGSGQQI